MKPVLLVVVSAATISLSGCGSGMAAPPPQNTYSIGGIVAGLSGVGLVLQNNGGDNLTVSQNGAFTFASSVAGGASYNVTVLIQPSNPSQTCVLKNGGGTASANVTDVQVKCTATNLWTWIGGSSGIDQLGVYGTLGMPGAANVPGGRGESVTWTDAAGNFWLFGGGGFDSAGAVSCLNDLWEYSNSEWTWTSGSNLGGQQGSYGTKGVADPSNVPGARCGSVSWTDPSGNLWLFGGTEHNDLWKYSAGEWTWVSGSDQEAQPGIYGTKGVPDPANVPGGREGSISWSDISGNFWLFGGYGFDSAGTQGDLNDLWEYSGGQWIWIGGGNTVNQPGVYGTKGTPDPANTPGSRSLAASWTDENGDFWLFGGGPSSFVYNDLWRYSGGEWTWMSGSDKVEQAGSYGTMGIPSSSNTPGARFGSVTWIDLNHNLWLFGGFGVDATTNILDLNDLWFYANGEWTWVSGSNLANQSGVYGTEGIADANNVPSSRYQLVSWRDSSGKLWLFGGYDDTDQLGRQWRNDLWKFEP